MTPTNVPPVMVAALVASYTLFDATVVPPTVSTFCAIVAVIPVG